MTYIFFFFNDTATTEIYTLSLHDALPISIRLYEKLGFQRVPVFALKTKSPLNEKLFAGPPPDEKLNPYAMIIINEARRRGDRKSTRLNSSHANISYAVFCLKKKKNIILSH